MGMHAHFRFLRLRLQQPASKDYCSYRWCLVATTAAAKISTSERTEYYFVFAYTLMVG